MKQSVEITSEDVVQDSDLDKHTTTTREKMSVYFTIAAAAFGLISDGCESHHQSYSIRRRGVLGADGPNPYIDQNNLMTMTNVCYLLFDSDIKRSPDCSRWCLNACTQKTIRQPSLHVFPMPS